MRRRTLRSLGEGGYYNASADSAEDTMGVSPWSFILRMGFNLHALQREALKKIRNAKTLGELDAVWREYFGSKGQERKRAELGKAFIVLRGQLEAALAARRKRIEAQEIRVRIAKERIDVTRPGIKIPRGHLHPLTFVRRKVVSILGGLGFSVVEGPEVETEWYNFDALNIPADHPARDMWDTLWLRGNQKIPNPKSQTPNKSKIQNPKFQTSQGRLLLRTHTSPVQIRYMETHNPPFRIIAPGRVYRFEATDAAHDIQFHQLEGLMVGERGEVTVAHFKGIIQEFFRQFFQKEVQIRLRPSYFPFVEPGFEVDVSCTVCMKSKVKGQRSKVDCSVCKGSRWLEMMGAGMVHPAVFNAVKYNPRAVQGFAFGIGLERLAMMKWRIPDIRLFRSGDLRFLKQF